MQSSTQIRMIKGEPQRGSTMPGRYLPRTDTLVDDTRSKGTPLPEFDRRPVRKSKKQRAAEARAREVDAQQRSRPSIFQLQRKHEKLVAEGKADLARAVRAQLITRCRDAGIPVPGTLRYGGSVELIQGGTWQSDR